MFHVCSFGLLCLFVGNSARTFVGFACHSLCHSAKGVRIGAMACTRVHSFGMFTLGHFPSDYRIWKQYGFQYGRFIDRWYVNEDYMLVIFRSEWDDTVSLVKIPKALWPWMVWDTPVGIARCSKGGCDTLSMVLHDTVYPAPVDDKTWCPWRKPNDEPMCALKAKDEMGEETHTDFHSRVTVSVRVGALLGYFVQVLGALHG